MNPVTRKIVSASRIVHLVCSMLAIGAIVFFAATGFMLNNEEMFDPGDVEEKIVEATLPEALVSGADEGKIVSHLADNFGVSGELNDFIAEEDFIELTFKRPGGRTDVSIERPGGEMEIRTEPRSIATVLFDLHKGSSAGSVWAILIDAAAICLLLACVTGIILWLATPRRRALGLIAMVIGLLAWCGAYFLCVPK